MTVIGGETLEGLSATTLWTLHNRGAEARRSDDVVRAPRAAGRNGVTLQEFER